MNQDNEFIIKDLVDGLNYLKENGHGGVSLGFSPDLMFVAAPNAVEPEIEFGSIDDDGDEFEEWSAEGNEILDLGRHIKENGFHEVIDLGLDVASNIEALMQAISRVFDKYEFGLDFWPYKYVSPELRDSEYEGPDESDLNSQI